MKKVEPKKAKKKIAAPPAAPARPAVKASAQPSHFLVYGFSRMDACLLIRPPFHRQAFVLIGGERDSIELELGQVQIDRSINTRQIAPTESELAALAASIKSNGLLEPCGVMAGPIDPIKWAKARRLNLVENVRRSDLAPWEVASALYEEKKGGATIDQMEANTGLSVPHLYNLIRLRENLAPELWEILQRAGRSASVRDFIDLCGKPHAEQLAEWQRKTSGGNKPPPGKGSPRPRAKSLLRVLPEGPPETEPRLESAEWAAGARFALRAIAGEVQWSPSAR